MTHVPSPSELAARLPDDPGLVDTRGMLLSGRCQVLARDVSEGFVVLARDWSVGSVVGRPEPALIRAATRQSGTAAFNLLVRPDAVAWVRPVLPAWRARRVMLHTLVGAGRAVAGRADVRIFDAASAPPLDHLPAELRRELGLALGPGAALPAGSFRPAPVAAAFEGGLAVAFCYPVWRTERWWDVSVDTLEGYRGRGLAAHASLRMIERMAADGLAPVWGALEDNQPSRRLAAKLGFAPIDELIVFSSAEPGPAT